MKKTLCLLLAILMLLPLLYSCGDKKNPASDFEYEENENGGITINFYIGADTSVVIPSVIDGKSVTHIGTGAFWRQGHVTSVVIPDSVTSMSSMVFAECVSLQRVQLSQNLSILSSETFRDCTTLSDVKLPKNLTEIQYAAFANCTSLKEIVLPNSVVTIGQDAFSLSGLTSITLNEGLEVIQYYTFCGTAIKNIILPSTVKIIQDGAFSSCDQLDSIVLNEGLVEIEIGAIADLPRLTEIVIPSTVESMCQYSIIQCENMSAIKFEGNAPDNFINSDAGFAALFEEFVPQCTVYYHEGAEGFTSPEWNGYPTKTW